MQVVSKFLSVRVGRTAATICALAFSLFAQALPVSSDVPGGVAVLPLSKMLPDNSKPQAWLGSQEVLVTAENSKWYAVVGLALDTKPGKHVLNIKVAGKERALPFKVKFKKYPEQHITLKDKSKVDLSPEDLARAERDIGNIQKLKHHWQATTETDVDFILPAEGKLGGRFGVKRFFNGEQRNPHAGLDMVVESGTPVKAAAGGQVLAVDDYFFNGKTVFIDHGNGLLSMYCHLDRIDVQAGQAISKGQPVGLSGMTGRATGPHLHWSVVLNGVMVDPEVFVAKWIGKQ